MNVPKFMLNKIQIKNRPIWIFHQCIKTVPKNIELQIDSSVRIGDFKQYKSHPGKYSLKCIELPEKLEESINKVLGDYNIKALREQAKNLKLYLHDRRCPKEKNEIYELKDKIREKLLLENEEQCDKDSIEKQIEKILRTKVHRWLKIDYTETVGHLYLASRFASDYAVLSQIFNEIKKRDESFHPNNVFDFGSGVGTVMWASQRTWPNQSIGFLNIDSSSYMNTIANLITRDGIASNSSCFKNMFFKRNFPKSDQEEYELVTSAFTLFELPDRASRFQHLSLLWNKLKKDGYLVLVENGNKNGFNLINEAREFFFKEIFDPKKIINRAEIDNGHIFSPCPHSQTCPLVTENLVCRFFVRFKPLKVYDWGKGNDANEEFPYSYIVLKKSPLPETKIWPRLVYRQPLKIRGGIIHSWLCTEDGNVEHLVASKNRNKTSRSLLRYSKLGDSLPIHLDNKK